MVLDAAPSTSGGMLSLSVDVDERGASASYTYGQRGYLTLTQGIHSGFTRFRKGFAPLETRFAEVRTFLGSET